MACNMFLNMSGSKKMPALGLGTWESKDDDLETALNAALEVGYRHIDSAQGYQNEEAIGRVLKKWFDSGKLKREDIFITTKLSSMNMYPEKVDECIASSLTKLQLDYVDLYLMHFPVSIKGAEGPDPIVRYPEVWKKMEEQFDAGKAKNIGISNFNKRQVENLLKSCRIKPANNQIELHIYLQQKELVDYCQQNGVTVTAYSPLGARTYNVVLERLGMPTRQLRDTVEDETVKRIGKKHSKTPAQISLRFLLQLGLAPIPKSVNPKRLKENFAVFDFNLDDEDMAALRDLEVGSEARVCNWKFWNNITEHPEYPF